jgi:hypothetical protein
VLLEGLLVLAALADDCKGQFVGSVPSPPCEDRARSVAVESVVRIGGHIPTPKRTAFTAPARPEGLTPLRCPAIWIGEIVVDAEGRVAGVWSLVGVPGDPRWNMSIREAVARWRYDSTVVGGKKVAICMTVTQNVR